MKRLLSITVLTMLFEIGIDAQLKVSSNGNVGIGNYISLNPKLTVGGELFSQNSDFNIGTASSTTVENSLTNIGLEGIVCEGSLKTPFSNQGVRGMAKTSNASQGRNYGVSGILAGDASTYGGAGIYGATSFLKYLEGTNIQGKYAGYFDGDVYVVNSLSANRMLLAAPHDYNLTIMPIEDGEGRGLSTLDNVLSMSVIEYDSEVDNKDLLSSEHLEKVLAEHPEYRDLIEEDLKFEPKHHYGISAEGLQELYPSLVEQSQDGTFQVNYVELVPILVRSIQLLKKELDEMNANPISARKSSYTSGIASSLDISRNILFQNKPNPFKEKTTIRFRLADNVRDASICIFDLSGKMLKKIPVTPEMESVSVNGYELGEGMFLYSLVINGVEIDTKRMILSK